nr:class I SAM-dependent methyltransferase [uncultured Methanoregula sp.]
MFESNNYIKNNPIYSNTKEYSTPKESFKCIVDLIQKRYAKTPLSILDVGCATGAFLYYAKKNLTIKSSIGIDVSDEHLMQASANMPDTEFIVENILSPKKIKGRKVDVVTCLGTLSIFDEIDMVMKNLLELVNEGGSLYVHDLVNKYPVDVLMRYRRADDEKNRNWMSGFNVRSMKTYESIIKGIDEKSTISFFPFSMPFQIPISSDPMRAWTIKTEDDPHQIIVGTMQLLNFMIIEVKK